MLKLIDYKEVNLDKVFNYKLMHCTDGLSGTCLEVPLTMIIRPDGNVSLKIVIDECVDKTPQLALDKMISWLNSLANGINGREEISIPIM